MLRSRRLRVRLGRLECGHADGGDPREPLLLFADPAAARERVRACGKTVVMMRL
ncbi:hypothetical protein [Rhodococcus sp. A14]|uniref:hypothetical protein n=1 Tax=Rhodococcus sp. A14 TaxID=1194106 RepID=UPI001420E3F0|nr:hypothetical protein [Rhodococcus sp. A14]